MDQIDTVTSAGASDLRYLLIGAGISLAITLFVQVLVVPCVVSAERRRELWRRLHRELGDLLSYDVQAAVTELVDSAENVIRRGAGKGRRAELLAATRRLETVARKSSWLCEQIISMSPHAPRMKRFIVARDYWTHGIDQMCALLYRDVAARATSSGDWTEFAEQFYDGLHTEFNAREEHFHTLLPDLVRSRPPARLPWRYFWHWQKMRRARARLAKRRRQQ